MKSEACVIHVDIDAFFASVEKLRNPRLARRPVAVGAGVIASCCYEARRSGLHAGMPLREARKRCPGLVVLEGHYPIYRCFAEKVFDLCRQYAPALECHLDEAFCDLTGTQRLYGFESPLPDRRPPPTGGSLRRTDPAGFTRPPPIARELVDRIRSEVGLDVSLGMGRNRMFAKMASKSAKPAGLRRIVPDDEDGFLRALPVRLLPGVGPRTEALLAKLNIQTIEEMRALPRDSLKALFGQNGILLYERCRGQDTRVVSTREIPRSISRETSFHEDTIGTEEIEGMLHYLAERAGNALRGLGLKARTVEVKIRYADFQEASGGRTLRAPTQVDGEIFATAMALRRSLHTRRAARRLIGVTLSRLSLDDGTHPLDLFDGGGEALGAVQGDIPGLFAPANGPTIDGVLRADSRRRRSLSLCRSLDQIRERFGYSSVVSGPSIHLLGKLPQDAHGYILRTPCLTR